MEIEQFVMAYRADHEKIKALLGQGLFVPSSCSANQHRNHTRRKQRNLCEDRTQHAGSISR